MLFETDVFPRIKSLSKEYNLLTSGYLLCCRITSPVDGVRYKSALTFEQITLNSDTIVYCRQTDRRTNRQMDGQTDERTDRWMDGQRDRQADERTDGWTEKQTDERTVGWTDRQTDGEMALS